jgi:L-ascorbate metabolism protein UlaG (beta-lactamase superfamily)
MQAPTMEKRIFWVGHASFYIKADDATIFIDPFKVSGSVKERADLVLITHAHPDHNSEADIEKIAKDTTKFIAANKCAEGREKSIIGRSKPGYKTKFKGIGIEAVAAYNDTKERMQYHPKSEEWVGYIIDIGGTRIYHAGDTDNIKEMSDLKDRDIDIALLPVGGTYTMGAAEAVHAAKAIAPKRIVPMHYKMLLGKEKSEILENELKSKLDNIMVMREVQEPLYYF